jgi:hypothetical protein
MIKARRAALRLSISAAARAARVDRDTWASAESGTRDLREFNYAGIERALAWGSGSVDQILAGGDPATLTRQDRQQALDADDLIISTIWQSSLPVDVKLRLVERTLEDRAEADRRAMERVTEWVTMHQRKAT